MVPVDSSGYNNILNHPSMHVKLHTASCIDDVGFFCHMNGRETDMQINCLFHSGSGNSNRYAGATVKTL